MTNPTPPPPPPPVQPSWYVRPTTGGQYGPASQKTIDQWVRQGRIQPNAQVWRDGWAQWRIAATVFKELQSGKSTHHPASNGSSAQSQKNKYRAWERAMQQWHQRVASKRRSSFWTTVVLAGLPCVGFAVLIGVGSANLEGTSSAAGVIGGVIVGTLFAGGLAFMVQVFCSDEQFAGTPPSEPAQLFACPSCRQGVSNYASACPHCGHPLRVAQQQRQNGVFLVTGVDINNDGQDDFYAGFGA